MRSGSYKFVSPASLLVLLLGAPPAVLTAQDETPPRSGSEPAAVGRDAEAAGAETEAPQDEAPDETPPAPPPTLALTAVGDGRIASPGGSSDAAWADYDNDGIPDLAIAGDDSVRLLRGDGEGGFAAAEIAAVDTSGTRSLAWADYDNDGDLDLFLARSAGRSNLLLANEPIGRLGAVEAGELSDGGDADAAAACWADFDGDGHLDLYVVNAGGGDNLLYRGRSDATFSRVTDDPAVAGGGDGRACAAGDLDGDGRADLYVGNFAGDDGGGARNALFLNRGDGRFGERPFSSAVSLRHHTTSVSFVDYDYDLDLDLLVTNSGEGEPNVFFLNDGSGRFSRVFESPLAGNGELRTNAQAWADLDADGRLDAYLAGGDSQDGRPNALFLGDARGGFAAVAEGEAVTASGASISVGTADFDRDGDPDLLVVDEDGGRLYENPTSPRRWLALRLQGDESNRMGLGARVSLTARVQQKSLRLTRWLLSGNAQSEPLLLFGLGERGRPLELEITWPSGRTDKHQDLQANRAYLATEGGDLVEQP